VKLEDNLRQIEKRIAELQRKADWIKSQLTTPAIKVADIPTTVVEAVEQAEEVLIEQPRRRGRRKLNETE
jgi:predicted  nucleic acid-binding Zn-ribbon protein